MYFNVEVKVSYSGIFISNFILEVKLREILFLFKRFEGDLGIFIILFLMILNFL